MHALFAGLVAIGLAASPALAQVEAVQGMDVVSLRDAGRSVGGEPRISTHWKGREWRFSNEANRAAFEANPKSYAPAFGGHCPVALADGRRRPGEPRYYVVVNGTLYLTGSAEAQQRLAHDPRSVLDQAAQQWKRLPK